jgi:hypothetical protein
MYEHRQHYPAPQATPGRTPHRRRTPQERIVPIQQALTDGHITLAEAMDRMEAAGLPYADVVLRAVRWWAGRGTLLSPEHEATPHERPGMVREFHRSGKRRRSE